MTDNKTATERLRELLDERGVEYEVDDETGVMETSWRGCTAFQLSPTAKMTMIVTPEQAIAATLGSEREKALEKLVQYALDEGHIDEWWYEDALKLGLEANY